MKCGEKSRIPLRKAIGKIVSMKIHKYKDEVRVW